MRYNELLEEKDLLEETKTFEVPSQYGGEVRVWENPGGSALHALKNKFKELRGVTFPDGSYWVWQAYAATHQAIRQSNQLDTDAHFYIANAREPHDEGWTRGTWQYDNSDMSLWIDRNNVPSRLQATFHGPATFHKWGG